MGAIYTLLIVIQLMQARDPKTLKLHPLGAAELLVKKRFHSSNEMETLSILCGEVPLSRSDRQNHQGEIFSVKKCIIHQK
jgi:hypothetical protein